MATYRAGIIGTGGIAGMGILGLHDTEDIGEKKFPESHAGGYHATDDIELVAVADVDEERVHRFADAWDIPEDGRYVGHDSMLDAEALDVVSVCTPTYLHHEHVVDAARSAADPAVIWCEKPISSSVTDAETMIDVCDETDTELVVNHSFRFTDKLQALRAHMDEGLLGEVKAVSAQFRRELVRNSTHLLDMLVYLLDARASQISGYLNEKNGTFATIDCTVAREISSMSLTFIGTEGKLYLNNDDGEWRYWRLEDGTHVEESLPGIEGAWEWEVDYRDAFANAAAHIVDLLDGTVENHSPGVEAARSIEIIVGFYLSHYIGGHVDVPLARPLRDVTVTSW